VRRDPTLVDELAGEMMSQAVASNLHHSATMDDAVKPLFACVLVSTFEDVGNTIDDRVTSALNALDITEFNVDAVIQSLRNAMLC
jgi:hypothetical protein